MAHVSKLNSRKVYTQGPAYSADPRVTEPWRGTGAHYWATRTSLAKTKTPPIKLTPHQAAVAKADAIKRARAAMYLR